MAKPRSKHCSGSFFQLVSFQFGQFKILVRYEVDCADFAAAKAEAFEESEQLPEKQQFPENPSIGYIEYGDVPANVPLQLVTTYPQGAGFPFFTWGQMFFTSADQEVVGFFKGTGDFAKPAFYGLNDVSKLMKPLPYAALSKVHDSLYKVRLFLLRNDPKLRFGLIWKGKGHLEIYTKSPKAEGAVSKSVHDFLLTQCKSPEENDLGKEGPPPATQPAASAD
uniref:Uncharacterized protein n=1 Tax=Globodera rostochiensis TaxID=31243 RepID=A0A914GVE6_GLORO